MLKRKNKFKKILKKIEKSILKRKKAYLLLLILISLSIISIFLYNKYINNPKNIAKSIYFDKNIILWKDLEALINFTTKELSWTNTAKEKIYNYKKQKEKIISNFKFIDNINIDPISSNELKVSYTFKSPKLILNSSWTKYLVYNNYTIYKFKSLNTGFKLTWVNQINLPKYVKTTKYIFWKNKLEKILEYLKKIKQVFPKSQITYYPWWEILEINYKNKKIWFNLDKNIDKQLNNFLLIKRKIDLDKIKFIDIWSLENSAFIK